MSYKFERMKYWPRWMRVMYPPTSGSVLATFFINSFLPNTPNFERDLQDFFYGETYSGWSHQRLGWYSFTTENYNDEINILFFCGAVSGSISRALSFHDFMHAIDPVFYLDTGGVVLLRNLEVKNLTYLGSGNIQTDKIVVDSDIWIQTTNTFERIPATSPEVNIDGEIEVDIPPGTLIKYSSEELARSLDSSGFISINGGPLNKLIKIDFKNVWDDHALILDLKRFKREDNYSLYKRLTYSNAFRGGTTKTRLSAAVAGNLGLLGMVTWIPTGQLHLPSNTFEALVKGIKRTSFVVEDPRSVSKNIYRLYKIPKYPIRSVLAGGFFSYPVSAIDNLLVVDTDNHIRVIYSYQSYKINRGTSGEIVNIVPDTYNLNREEELEVYFSKNIKVETLANSDKIINPDGSGTKYLMEIAKSISSKVQITFGHVRWKNVVWFEDHDKKPHIQYIPRFLDKK